MKKATVTVTFDDEKLGALEFSLRKEHSSVQEHLEDALERSDMKNRAGAAGGSIWTARLSLLPSPSARPNPLLRKRRIVNRSPRQPW